jgi:hypothetical protein
VSAGLFDRQIAIPMHAGLTALEVETVAEAVLDVVASELAGSAANQLATEPVR